MLFKIYSCQYLYFIALQYSAEYRLLSEGVRLWLSPFSFSNREGWNGQSKSYRICCHTVVQSSRNSPGFSQVSGFYKDLLKKVNEYLLKALKETYFVLDFQLFITRKREMWNMLKKDRDWSCIYRDRNEQWMKCWFSSKYIKILVNFFISLIKNWFYEIIFIGW